jgi:hypothetical protein
MRNCHFPSDYFGGLKGKSGCAAFKQLEAAQSFFQQWASLNLEHR